jgi:hypothetical protein
MKVVPLRILSYLQAPLPRPPSKMSTTIPRRSRRLATKAKSAALSQIEISPSYAEKVAQAEAEAEHAKHVAEVFEEIKKRRYQEQLALDAQLYMYDETHIDYWVIYTKIFQHFYNNLSYFKNDFKIINEMIDTGAQLVEVALENYEVSSSTGFVRLAERVIGAATIALRTDGRVIL